LDAGLNYVLYYAPYPEIKSPKEIKTLDLEHKTEFVFDGKGYAFYVAVKAYQGDESSEFSNVEYFDLTINPLDIDISDRQTDFVSASGYPTNGMAYPTAGEDLMAVSADEETESKEQVSREIEEADIIRIDQNYLYILNQYRGLIVCDISDPDHPSIRSRLPVTGNPIDMYIRANQVFIIVSENAGPYYVKLLVEDSNSAPSVKSRVDVVDVSDKSKSKLSSSFDLEGRVTDSRIVGDILYVVSSKEETFYYMEEPMIWDELVDISVGISTDDTVSHDMQKPEEPGIYVASIDISDINQIRLVDQEELTGSAQFIHVTEQAIFISSNLGYYVNDKSTVKYVDIADPNGDINKRGEIHVPGNIQDKFKMDFYNGYLRVCTYEWQDSGLSNLFCVIDQLQSIKGFIAAIFITAGAVGQ